MALVRRMKVLIMGMNGLRLFVSEKEEAYLFCLNVFLVCHLRQHPLSARQDNLSNENNEDRPQTTVLARALTL